MRSAVIFGLLATLLSSYASAHVDESKMWEIRSDKPQTHPHIPYSAADAAYNKSIQHFACGTHATTHASQQFLDTISKLSKQHKPSSHSLRARRAASHITVPLYMHIVTTAAKVGTIPQSMVTAQFAALNTAYNPYGIFFTLQNVDYTSNDAWAVGATSTDDTNMKTALRQGTYDALNLYFQTDLVGGILGKCSMPVSVGSSSPASAYATDGCNTAAGTMPNGPIMGYNLGMTAVHETGHWLGLLHTFEGYSCSGSGDYVDDTPPEATSTNGCPTSPWKNTCPRPAGYFSTRRGDPIWNYMDYSIDACYAGFTQGQIGRIQSVFGMYRAGN